MGESGTLSSLWWTPSWKSELIASFLASKSGGDFLDVGANVGQTLFDFVSTGSKARYFGFEPNMGCVAYLDRLIRDNGLESARIIPVALGSRASVVELHRQKNSATDSGAFIDASIRPGLQTCSEFISCHPFDEIVDQVGIGRIALCKIDVEGFEAETLDGMRKTLEMRRFPILCEVLDADPQADAALHDVRLKRIETLLSECRYRIERVEKGAEGGLAGLAPIAALPRRRYDEQSKEACDYLFSPTERSRS